MVLFSLEVASYPGSSLCSLGYLEVRPCFYAVVLVVMLSKEHWTSSAVQEEGITNEDRHHLLLLHEQGSLSVGILLREI